MRKPGPMIFLGAAALVLIFAGCGGDSTEPPPPVDPWAFPADSSRAIRLYSPTSSCAVGDSVEFKVIFSGLGGVFGAAFEVSYPAQLLRVEHAEVNPGYFPGSTVEVPVRIDADAGRLAYGVSYLASQPRTEGRDGVLLKFTCVALATGSAELGFPEAKLEIRAQDGTRIEEDPAVGRVGVTIVVR